jgi:hypothetical protein
LSQGTRPNKKSTKIPDVKRYLKSVTVAQDGLLVVKLAQLFQPTRDRIVVPRSVLHGLLTAIHLRLDHPTKHQMKQLVSKYFFALSLDAAIQTVVDNCHHCAALKKVPTYTKPQTSSAPPHSVGSQYAADIMRRDKQLILVVRETVSSFTFTTFASSEKHQDLRDALVKVLYGACRMNDTPVIVRTDPAPGFVALVQDALLKQHNIHLEIGNPKNPNKNPVAEHAIGELLSEILHVQPEGGPISPLLLSIATANMNARIRHSGLSALEIWTQRDQITGEQLPLTDRQLITSQYNLREGNHNPSATSKGRGKILPPHTITQGDLVYLLQDRDKRRARDKYLVTGVNDDHCTIRKFTRQQFRSRSYKVPLHDCYPVLSNSLPFPDCLPLDDISDDDDFPPALTPPLDHPPSLDLPTPARPEPNDATSINNNSIAVPPTGDCAPSLDVTSVSDSDSTVDFDSSDSTDLHDHPEPLRRSSRIAHNLNKPPAWQCDGSYHMDS